MRRLEPIKKRRSRRGRLLAKYQELALIDRFNRGHLALERGCGLNIDVLSMRSLLDSETGGERERERGREGEGRGRGGGS